MTGVLPEKKNTSAAGHEEDMHQFLREVRSYPLLTPEQERTVAKACAEGDEEAIRTLVNSNLRLVVSIAREYAGRGVPLLDLVQEGSIGLLKAARKFDYTLDYRFSTYATKWIRQGISRYIMDHAELIRVPRHTMEQMRKILQAKGALQRDGMEATVEQIARECDISADKVKVLLQLLPQVFSLDAPAGDADNDALQMLLEDVHAPQPQEELVRRELKQTIDTLLGMLPQRQQQVLRLRFGMEDGTCHTQKEIGQMLGISKERARQIERQAVDKLQKLGTSLGLEDFLDE